MSNKPGSEVRPDTAHALLERVARAQVAGRVPSLAVGLVRDGALAWFGGRGEVGGVPPTADTQYRIGSITKGFTAVLIMRLRDEGLLRLDDRLEDHLPGTAFGDRTIRSLLSHSAGLAAEPPGPWWERSPGVAWEQLGPSFTSEHALGPPGRFHYSNIGYALLGRIIETHRERSWYAALSAEVLDPLEMTRTTYEPADPYAPGLAVHPYADLIMTEEVQDLAGMAPAGQLWSTVSDLARWAGLVAGDAGGVLSPETVAEMRGTQVIADDPQWQAGYGLGFQVLRTGERELVGHGGSVPGYIAYLVIDLERRIGTVELANSTSGAAALCGPDLLEIVHEREPRVVESWRPQKEVPSDLLDLVGLWHWGPSPFLVWLREADRLEMEPVGGRGRASMITRTAAGEWVGQNGYWAGEVLRAVRRADGSVSHLDFGTFVFTRQPYDPDAPVPGGVPERPWST